LIHEVLIFNKVINRVNIKRKVCIYNDGSSDTGMNAVPSHSSPAQFSQTAVGTFRCL